MKKSLLFIIMLNLSIILSGCSRNKEISVRKWNTEELEKIVLVEYPVKDYVTDTESSSFRLPEKDRDQFIKEIESLDSFVSKVTLKHHLSEGYEGWLFFTDNNYTFLYYDEDNDLYWYRLLFANLKVDDYRYKFPFIEQVFINVTKTVEYQHDFDWDFIKDFYNRIDDDIVEIDDTNQIIRIKSYTHNNDTHFGVSEVVNIEIKFNENTLKITVKHDK